MNQKSLPLGSDRSKSSEGPVAPSAGQASDPSDEQLAAFYMARIEPLVQEAVGPRARSARVLVEVLAGQTARLVDRYGQVCAAHFLQLLGERLMRSSQIRIAEHEAAEAKEAGRRPS